MGGNIDSDSNPCDGSDVLAELNDVFNHPQCARYKFAQRNNQLRQDQERAGQLSRADRSL